MTRYQLEQILERILISSGGDIETDKCERFLRIESRFDGDGIWSYERISLWDLSNELLRHLS